MKSLVKIIAVAGIMVAASCKTDTAPNYQFFPNMYESVGYETYSESDAFNNGVAAQLPVDGTIKRGWMPFEVENTEAGRLFAKDSLVSPLQATEDNLANGKELFGVYCAVCHGTKGKGDGNLVKREKFLGVPNYADRDITEGSIYHVLMYGKNLMGSHASQVDAKERWQISAYAMSLREKLIK